MNRTTKKLFTVCLGAAMLLGFAGVATAGMYKWTDKNGDVHYSQQPPAEGNYETMHVDTQSPNGLDTGSGSQSSPSYSTPSGTNSSGSGSANGSGSSALQQTEAKAAAQRQQNCVQAKKALETYTVYRRLRNKDGTVIRLSDTERAKRIDEAKSAIQEFCQ